jgi:hypothetical protein
MQFDPKVSFWLGVVVTALIGIGGGTVSLTHAVPPDWIPTVVAWCNIPRPRPFNEQAGTGHVCGRVVRRNDRAVGAPFHRC